LHIRHTAVDLST